MATPWRRDPLSKHAYGSATSDQAALRREQDRAAGGRRQRVLDLLDGRTALGRVRLVRRRRARRVYAVLVWNDSGRQELLIAEVTEASRFGNLRTGWDLVQRHGLADPANRGAWPEAKRRL